MTKFEYITILRYASNLLFDRGFKPCNGYDEMICTIIATDQRSRRDSCSNCIYNHLLKEGLK